MQFKSGLLILASVIATALAATVQDILNDLATINTQTASLDNQIRSFTSPTQLATVVAIQTASSALVTGTNTATDDTNNTPQPFSEADGNTLLTTIQNGLGPQIITTLSDIVAKHSVFEAVPITGTVQQVHTDLVNLQTATAALGQALIRGTPPDLLDEANALDNQILSAFASAVAAFAS